MGVAEDAAKAVEWYERAAEQGYPRAQCNLGYCYESGKGVKEDKARAVKLYRQAAEQGSSVGQCNLGYCMLKGSAYGLTRRRRCIGSERPPKALRPGHVPAG
ncbi:sel1 repeat family protein [Flavonifractor plautii]|nr:sel1 repeat family protein [Flavonifractor plautii]